jgi:hypothetical protein
MAKRTTNGGNMPSGMNPEDTCPEVYRKFLADPDAFLIKEKCHG